MVTRQVLARRAALYTSISMFSLLLASGAANAQSSNIGSVDVQSNGAALPLSAPLAVGSKAPAGSAPALAPSQGSLNAIEPVSVISDKVIHDIIPAGGDYNETAKYTPGFLSNNTNGLLGDSKSGWRGYSDGQFNVTFDGIPFGDANDPTHHSAAYFPSAFLGSVVIDRGPGAASQVGYATFGGTMALNSIELSDIAGGHIESSFGTFNTRNTAVMVQTGEIGSTGVRALFEYSNGFTYGALTNGKVATNQFLAKAYKKLGDFTLTVFSSFGTENYNNTASITYPQLLAHGKRYGALNTNPLTQQFVGYNNSQKQTDMEYVDLAGGIGNWRIDNKVYTYSYTYPELQNNGNDQTVEGLISASNGAVTQVSIPTITGGKTKVTIPGVAATDVVGYIKNNNYRAYGDIFKAEYDVHAGIFSGTVRTGLWVEHIDNTRLQEYIDYTTGQTFPTLTSAMSNSNQASYKLNLSSRITNYQPFVEYDWQPIAGLTITPGFKFEAFTRDHNALVNQTTLQPENFSKTYTANLPFLAARYKLTPELSVYAQASEGYLAPTVSAFYVFDPQLAGIKPQATINYQAGTVYKTGKITADFDVYQVTATNFPVTTLTSTGETIYTNGGTAQYRGVEAEGSYSVMNGLSVYGSGALVGAKYISGQYSAQRVGDAPSYTGVAGVIYDDGHFFGSILQKFTGDYFGSSGQMQRASNTVVGLNHVKAYNTTDLVVGMRLDTAERFGVGKTATVKLGVYNALDHRNTTEIAGKTTGLTSINNNSLTYTFLPGRTIYGTVGFDF